MDESKRSSPSPPDVLAPEDFADHQLCTRHEESLYQKEDLVPATFLGFAKDELRLPDSRRHRVNAVGNAKRAFALQLVTLTDALGYKHLPRRERRGVLARLRFAGECGAVAPRVLSRLNELRRQVEHEYRIPTRLEAEDFAETIELFLASSDRLTQRFPTVREMELGGGKNAGKYCLGIERSAGVTRLFAGSANNLRTKGREALVTANLRVDSGEFFNWVKLLLRGGG